MQPFVIELDDTVGTDAVVEKAAGKNKQVNKCLSPESQPPKQQLLRKNNGENRNGKSCERVKNNRKIKRRRNLPRHFEAGINHC